MLAFFGCLLTLGLGIVRDYGLPGDDEIQRMTGQVSLFYVFQQLPTAWQQHLLPASAVDLIKQKGSSMQLHTYRDRDYGVAFELPAAALEQALRLHEPRQKFLLRHTLNFLVCFGGIVALYFLVKQRYDSWRLGLLGALLLALSPRQFADYFYNSKDAVFMALFTAAVTTSIYFLKRPTWRRALGHALVSACAIDVRLMAALVPAATLALLALRAGRGEYPQPGRRVLASAGLYMAALALLVMAMWPFLWEAPLTNFMAAWRAMSHFRATGEILYQGHYVWAHALPWHYALGWISVTEPLFYLAWCGVGMAVVLGTLLRRRTRLYVGAEWQDLVVSGLALAPLLTVAVLHSVLYNGWRQLYFVHPLLLLLALRGLVAAWRWQPAYAGLRRYWQPALAAISGGALLWLAGQLIQLHPLQNLYFNALAAQPIEQHYETDYWLLGYRPALEWVAQHDARPQLRVAGVLNYAVEENLLMLPPALRARLALASGAEQADYYFITYNQRHEPPPARLHPQLVYTMWAGSVRVLAIYRLH